WMMRFPENSISPGRLPSLIQPADLPATICDFCRSRSEVDDSRVAERQSESAVSFGMGKSILPLLRGEAIDNFDRACIAGSPDQQVLVTPIWSLRVVSDRQDASEARKQDAAPGDAPEPKVELFVKPDDWFEVNNVADRCPEIVEKMQIALSETVAACQIVPPA